MTTGREPRGSADFRFGKHQIPYLLLLAIILVAFALRIWGIGFGLPHRYHVDEPPYIVAALRIAQGDLHISYPYASPNVYQFALTGLYATWYGFGMLQGTFESPDSFARQYLVDPSGFYLLARGVTAILGSITVLIVYLLGAHVGDTRLGLLAAFLLSISFIAVRESHYATTDTLITLLTSVSLLSLVAFVKNPQHPAAALVGSGVAGGAATGLKYFPVLALLPALLAVWLIVPDKSPPWRRVKLTMVLAISSLFGYLVAFPAIAVDSSLFLQQWSQIWDQASNALGGVQVSDSSALVYYLDGFRTGLGSFYLLAVAAGVIFWLTKRRESAHLLLLLFFFVYLLGISVVETTFARYALPLVPILALLAADGLLKVASLLSQTMPSRIHDPKVTILIVLIVVASAFPFLNTLRHNWLLTQDDTRTQSLRWVESNLPPGTKLANQWYGPPISTDHDLEPGTSSTFEVTILDPFASDPLAFDLQSYIDNGVEVFIVNDWSMSFDYEDKARREQLVELQEQLNDAGILVASFDPFIDGQSKPFVFEMIYGPHSGLWERERPGPIIKVYQIAR